MNRINLIKNQLSNSESEEIVTVETYAKNPTIKIIRLNTPKSLNSLGKAMISKLYETIVKLDEDNETKVMILTGNGKAFAAGADIKYLNSASYDELVRRDIFEPIERIYYQTKKPLIAAVNGFCFGGGFELALSCDIIYASDKALFGFPEIKLGLFPGAGGTQRLVRLMGYHKAVEYVLTAKDFTLDELKNYGIINNVVPHDRLLEESLKLAETFSKFSIMALIAAKKSMKMALETTLQAGINMERYIFQGLANTEDKKRGTEAFIKKVKPEFIDK